MDNARSRGRQALHAWRANQPDNFYRGNGHLQAVLKRHWGESTLAKYSQTLDHYGSVVPTVLDEAAIHNNRHHNLPRLERYDDFGERLEGIEHHPSYHVCGKAIYEDGKVIASYAEQHPNLLAQALFYISSHVGEAGHNCPVACTAGVVKALQAAGSLALKEAYLPSLLTNVYNERFDGAQFLTEVQGGSDVGANCVEAFPDGEAMGTTRWKIRGEKWFCSNADADLILMTARVHGGPAGTRGLGLFLIPRRLDDGTANHFALRRLKDKLGTRSMPSAEIDFNDAVAYAVGPVDAGFATVINNVINTSRLYNTVGCTGIARRATLVARGYAEHREAFGQPVITYPLMQEMLASMYSTEAALLSGSMLLAAELDRVETNDTTEERQGALRIAINLSKMRSCQHSHRVVLTGIETLGGNGAIESFSVLPRLMRDNIVYENWEGTHNTLLAQTLRDCARHRLHDALGRWLTELLSGLDEHYASHTKMFKDALSSCNTAIDSALNAQDPNTAVLQARPHLERLADLFFAVALLADIASITDKLTERQMRAQLTWFWRSFGDEPKERDLSYSIELKTITGL